MAGPGHDNWLVPKKLPGHYWLGDISHIVPHCSEAEHLASFAIPHSAESAYLAHPSAGLQPAGAVGRQETSFKREESVIIMIDDRMRQSVDGRSRFVT